MPIVTPMIYTFKVGPYARNVYLYGTYRLHAGEPYSVVPADYYIPVEQYAAANYSTSQIENALLQGWINDQEYNETIAYIV